MPKKKRQRTLLVDGDVLVYTFAHRCQQVQRWHRDLWTMFARMDQASAEIDDFLGKLVENLDAERAVVALSDLDSNFRHKVFPGYKGNRAGTVRPMLFKPLREHLTTKWNARWYPNIEGDDLLGIWATHAGSQTEYVICSIDKDMRTIPGAIYDWNHPELGEQWVDEAEADYNHFFQALIGDRTDGYPGCPKIGGVRGERILEPYREAFAAGNLSEPWEEIVRQYEKAGGTREDAVMNARCARILRDGDYNFDTAEITLWTPPVEGK